MIKQFKDGSTLVTGNDLYRYFEKSLNKRNNYDKNCSFCEHEGNEKCDQCSLFSGDISCSCHINPPCSKCVDSMFEPTKYLINYKRYIENGNGKCRWECFRSDKGTWDVFSKMESEGWELSTEILSTGVIAIYLEKNVDEVEEIELCNNKPEFKNTTMKFINKVATKE